MNHLGFTLMPLSLQALLLTGGPSAPLQQQVGGADLLTVKAVCLT